MDETKCEQLEAWKKIITTSNIRSVNFFDPSQILERGNLQEKTRRIWKKIFPPTGFSKESNHARVFNSTSVGCLRYIFPPLRRRSFLGNFHRGEGRSRVEKAPNKRLLRVVTFSEWGTTEEGRSPIANRNKRKDNPAHTRRRTPA